jgi:hypothetical protein
MKKLPKCLLALAMAAGLAMTCTSASAYHCYWTKPYWSHGYHHASHKVCTGHPHYRHCGWRNGVRVCW